MSTFHHRGLTPPRPGSALARVHAALVAAGAVQRSNTEWSCFQKDKHSHDDKSGSLTARYGDKNNNAVMLACAKCGGIDNLLPRLGLAASDLVDAAPDRKTRHYVYRDEAGQPLFRVVKRPGTDGGKSRPFQQRADGHGGWINGVQGVPRVLYRLDELLPAINDGKTIHLTEGESDADALNAHFFRTRTHAWATCHPGGAERWLPEHTTTLAGVARVVVWADRDSPGYRCAHLRLSAVRGAGLKASARQPATGKDVRDHLAAGLTPEAGEKLKPKQLNKLSGTAVTVEGDRPEPDGEDPAVVAAMDRLRVSREAARRVAAEEAGVGFEPLPRRTLKEALTDRPEDPPELIERLHRRGYNTTITARYKTGKTTLGGNLLRSLADGAPFLSRFAVAAPLGRVGLLNYELTDADMLRWLDDQGIDNTDRIALLNLRGRALSLAHDRGRDELVAWCRDMDVTTLFLDPHRRAFSGFGEENSNDDVNRFTGVLDEVKTAAGVDDLFLFVHTGREAATAGSERARGATALDDWADQRWLMTKGTAADDARYLYADGRMAAVPEFGLVYDPATRRLTAQDGNRRTLADSGQRDEVLAALEAAGTAGANTTQIEAALGSTKKGSFSKLLQSMGGQGYIERRVGGPGKETRYWHPSHTPKDKA